MRATEGRLRLAGLLAGLILVAGGQVSAQAIPTDGRFALFWNWSQRTPDTGESSIFSELISMLSIASDPRSESTFEYSLDLRYAAYPDTEYRDDRLSLYDAWIGLRGQADRWKLRVGQMWLHELGGLGSVGGLFGEYRVPGSSSFGQLRFGAFGGLEPKILETGYVDGITKGGVYAAVDGANARRHVLGWVLIRNEEVTERSVVVFNNYIPVKRKFFLYEALNYDIEGPAGLGSDNLTYFFTNLRYAFSRAFELQGVYHYGRSINARAITEDHIDGRPVDPRELEGLLFESGRIRLTVRPWRRVRLWGSYGRDRNNRDDEWYGRTNLGFSIRDIARVGLDLTVTNSRIDRSSGSHDSTYASLGKTFGRRVYVSVDYSTSLSVYYYRRDDGGTIESRPESRRWALNANINLNRTFSLLLVGEHAEHGDLDDVHILTGLSVRF